MFIRIVLDTRCGQNLIKLERVGILLKQTFHFGQDRESMENEIQGKKNSDTVFPHIVSALE